jgi:DNA-binding SARP family transcriptional activator
MTTATRRTESTEPIALRRELVTTIEDYMRECSYDAGVAGRPLGVVAVDGARTGSVALRVLGEVEAIGERGTFAPGRARPGAVLALLVMHAGECVSVDRMMDELWPAEPRVPGAKRVQVNVLRLRRCLARVAPGLDPAALVRTRSRGYSLEVDPGGIDAVRFARLVARGRAELDAGDPSQAAATVRDALAIWRDEPYADYAYEPFAAAEIRRLDELRTFALETWAEAELALGAHAAMAVELRRLVARHPLREHLHALLMVALYRCCRQGEALAAYQDARSALVEGLGVEPGHELRELQHAILVHSPALEPAAPRRPGLADLVRLPLAQAA